MFVCRSSNGVGRHDQKVKFDNKLYNESSALQLSVEAKLKVTLKDGRADDDPSNPRTKLAELWGPCQNNGRPNVNIHYSARQVFLSL